MPSLPRGYPCVDADDPALLALINKRFTLNLLIQGAASHNCLTAHHLVADELNAIDPALLSMYDKVTIGMFTNMWRGDAVLFLGRPARFWRRTRNPGHPFHHHPLMARHGAELAEGTRRHVFDRAKRKRAWRMPVLVNFNLVWLIYRLMLKERRHKWALERLAEEAVEMIYGIPADRLHAELTQDVRFGRIKKAHTILGRVLCMAAVGYSGPVHSGESFRVVGKAWVWPLLSHELVKGTTELICLHGLNTLDDATYRRVLAVTDHIEFEHWHMMAGSELWRRLLAAIPGDRPLADTLMRIARLKPKPLESLMFAVVEDTPWARELIEGLCEEALGNDE